MIVLLLSSLVGCAPQDAEVTGHWFTWLAANSSATVEESDLSFDRASVFECTGRGWDAANCDWEPGYIGPKNADDRASGRFIGGACAREYRESTEVCDGAHVSGCGDEELVGFAEECETLAALDFHKWINDDGYYGLHGTIEEQMWRSEAIINSEGDLQLTVHMDLGCTMPEDGTLKGCEEEDFRFHFTIDPDFDPVECLETEDGEAYVDHIDGSSWVDEWSENEDGYRIYYLNAGAYQVNPNDSENSWYLSNNMLAGYGFSKFAREDLHSRPGDYGQYEIDGTGPSFLGIEPLERETPDLDAYATKAAEYCQRALGSDCPVGTSNGSMSWQNEMVEVLGANANDTAMFQHKFEDNMWRPIDKTIEGLDGWMEVHSSWVRIKTGTTVAAGETVTGDFQILYEGAESGSRVLVRGEFETTNLREDRWGYEILEDAKREDNDTPYCGGAPMPS